MTRYRSLALVFFFLFGATTIVAGCSDSDCQSDSDCKTGRICVDGVCADPRWTEGAGSGGGTQCSCYCRCSSCSFSDDVTCTPASSVCGSCAAACQNGCSSNYCGSYLSSSGSCS